MPEPYTHRDTSTGEQQNFTTTDPKSNLLRTNSSDKNVRHGPSYITDMEAMANVVKGCLGAGSLAMPYAFSNSGLVVGIIGTLIVASVCTHCIHIMVKCSQVLCRTEGKAAMSYADTVEAAYRTGAGGRYRKWAPLMRIVSDCFLFFTYFGVNIAYVIFVASTFKQVLNSNLEYNLNTRTSVLLLSTVFLPIGMVRQMKVLTPFSAFANFLLLIGCVLTVIFCFTDMPPLSSRSLVLPVSNWPIFLSTALFSMEGVGVILPIENSMKNPSHFLGLFGILNISMIFVSGVYLVMGCAGYIKYGADVQGSITLNLPDSLLSEVVKVLVALAILLTYPLQLTASEDVVWYRTGRYLDEKDEDSGKYGIRALLIISSVCIAAAMPHLSSVISLVGAIGFSGLGLLLPTVTELVTLGESLSPCLLAKHLLVLLFWAVACVAGSMVSVRQILGHQ